MSAYPIGATIVLSVYVRDAATGIPSTPATAICRLIGPSKVEETPLTGVSIETGKFSVSYVPLRTGIWKYRWQTTGDARGAVEGTFEVASSFTIS